MREVGDAYFRIIKLPFELPTPFYGAMLAIWQLNPTLQRQFPLQNSKQEDYLNFLAWCAIRGHKQYAILRELPSGWHKALRSPIALPKLRGDQWGGQFSVGMFFFALVRCQFNLSAILWNVRYRRRFCLWYWSRTHEGFEFAQLDGWQKQSIEEEFGAWSQFELKSGFKHDIEDSSAFVGHLGGCVTNFLHEQCYDRSMSTFLLGCVPCISFGYIRRYLAERRECPSESELIRVCSTLEDSLSVASGSCVDGSLNKLQEGVNLFGYAQGELGIGEDVRMLALALDGVNVPFCIVNVRPGKDVSQKDESVMQWLVDEPLYSVNVFCMTGVEHLRYFLKNGSAVLKGRYTIGLWPWELPEWPKAWRHVYGLIHEIWGISRYTANAYVDADIPVRVMPLPVAVEPRKKLSRQHFGLPANTYLFFFAFDFNSTLYRKNPEAVLRAFMQAFPAEAKDQVGLVLKVSHVDQKNHVWQKLTEIIAEDKRVFLVEGSLRRDELLGLYDCCDCLVSLHRAEGFGRAIAEALLLGKQVVTTGFSGNMDFCDSERVALVDASSVPIAENEYFFAQGQSWGEPDVNQAALLMSDVLKSPRSTESDLMDKYTIAQAGEVYRTRLRAINKKIEIC